MLLRRVTTFSVGETEARRPEGAAGAPQPGHGRAGRGTRSGGSWVCSPPSLGGVGRARCFASGVRRDGTAQLGPGQVLLLRNQVPGHLLQPQEEGAG